MLFFESSPVERFSSETRSRVPCDPEEFIGPQIEP